jgi:methylenetetrahydrofolate--tRNA-(uracil-5-)-methyltransferase
LLRRGFPVVLHEMRPDTETAAHHTGNLAELVCSNSLRSDRIENAVGLLKEEMRRLGSLVMEAADASKVPAGGALAVDRTSFSEYIEAHLSAQSGFTLIREEVKEIPAGGPLIIAAGPLCSEALSASIQSYIGGSGLYFYDAAAPIVFYDSLNHDTIFRASRYGRGSDYLNCPMDRDEYLRFWNALCEAERVERREFERDELFAGCMPVEEMARRGEDTLRFGPLKPVGLTDPGTGETPYAVVQLRQDDKQGTLFNLVGFQTNLRRPEQKRVFGLIPGLEDARYARYGAMHRNTYIHSPGLLDRNFRVTRETRPVYFAGQITGVEGYVESAASGLAAGIGMAMQITGEQFTGFPPETMIGALGQYVSGYAGRDFQPMNANFGLLPPLAQRIRKKRERYNAYAARSLAAIEGIRGLL